MDDNPSMSLLPFTAYADVRAALGVTSTELPDRTLTLPLYSAQLELALEDVHPNIEGTYDTLSNLPADDLTQLQKRFLSVASLFATYAVAKACIAALPLFSLKVITDGRAEGERNADYYIGLRDDIDAMFINLKFRLSAIFAQIEQGVIPLEAPTPIHVLLSNLGTDPVTGG